MKKGLLLVGATMVFSFAISFVIQAQVPSENLKRTAVERVLIYNPLLSIAGCSGVGGE